MDFAVEHDSYFIYLIKERNLIQISPGGWLSFKLAWATYFVLEAFIFPAEAGHFLFHDVVLVLLLHAALARRLAVLH